MNNYLQQKIENVNGDLAILEDNLDHLIQPEYRERIKHVALRMGNIVRQLRIDLTVMELCDE